MTSITQVTEEKQIDELDFIKIKNFYESKNTISRVKSQPTKWEKIFANHISDKRLISRIHEELNKRQIEKWANVLTISLKKIHRLP